MIKNKSDFLKCLVLLIYLYIFKVLYNFKSFPYKYFSLKL